MANVNTEYGMGEARAPYPAGETFSTLGAWSEARGAKLVERSRMVSSMESMTWACSLRETATPLPRQATQHRRLDFASRIQHSRTASSLMQKSYRIIVWACSLRETAPPVPALL